MDVMPKAVCTSLRSCEKNCEREVYESSPKNIHKNPDRWTIVVLFLREDSWESVNLRAAACSIACSIVAYTKVSIKINHDRCRQPMHDNCLVQREPHVNDS